MKNTKNMVRVAMFWPRPLLEAVRQESRRIGAPVSELIRRAVAAKYKGYDREAVAEGRRGYPKGFK